MYKKFLKLTSDNKKYLALKFLTFIFFTLIKQFTSTIDDEVQDLEEVKLFQLKDSEGNILEIYE